MAMFPLMVLLGGVLAVIVIIVAVVLQLGLNTDDLKLLTAILVAVALSIPVMLEKRRQIASYKASLNGNHKEEQEGGHAGN